MRQACGSSLLVCAAVLLRTAVNVYCENARYCNVSTAKTLSAQSFRTLHVAYTPEIILFHVLINHPLVIHGTHHLLRFLRQSNALGACSFPIHLPILRPKSCVQRSGGGTTCQALAVGAPTLLAYVPSTRKSRTVEFVNTKSSVVSGTS